MRLFEFFTNFHKALPDRLEAKNLKEMQIESGRVGGITSIANSEEINDLGYRRSTSVDQYDQFLTETKTFSTSGGDSCRRDSEASTDESSFYETPSPSQWPGMTLPKSPVISVVAMQHHKTDENITEELLVELHKAKERFSKLLLGQDMSGTGKGVSSALAISHAVTNLYGSVFVPHQRLEPLPPEKKLIWKREMDWLLSVCDYIVEFVPTSRHLNDDSAHEVMTSRPRSDICLYLPALKKIDAMLLDTLDCFQEREFWYVEHGSISENSTFPGAFRRIPTPLRRKEKWWLPVPCVPPGGLSESSRKHLQDTRKRTDQLYKAAKALNCTILAEMDIPDPYIVSLPKNGKAIVGDAVYRCLCTTDKFRQDFPPNLMSISSEFEALELADKIEASIYTWRRKARMARPKSSWDLVRDLVSEGYCTEKNRILAERAERLLFSLKQKYPQLSQTSLDASKIQHNKDIGKAIIESYSRVMESLAFNTVACIEDVLFADKTTRCQEG